MHTLLLAAARSIPVVVLAAAVLAPSSATKGEAQGGAEAGRVWRNGTFTLRLAEMPCPFQDLASALEAFSADSARAAVLVQAGRPTVPACWALDPNDDVLVHDLGGGEGFIPLAWFRSEAGG